jgi:hypothetical protein
LLFFAGRFKLGPLQAHTLHAPRLGPGYVALASPLRSSGVGAPASDDDGIWEKKKRDVSMRRREWLRSAQSSATSYRNRRKLGLDCRKPQLARSIYTMAVTVCVNPFPSSLAT